MTKIKKKVCVVITARPSYSRVKTALKAISEHPDLELQLVVAASALLDKYGNPISFIEKDGFKVAAKVHMVLEGENLVTMAKTTGLGLLELPTVFDNLQPDMVITIADRFETISTAITAAYMNIPLVHIQGGEITGSIDERVRHAVTKLSNYHFVCTDLAGERVVRMGEEPDMVHVTGCPSIDIAKQVLDDPTMSFDVFEKYAGVGNRLDLSKGYYVVLQHPVTTESDQAKAQILETLHAVADLHKPVLWFWPNVDAGSDGTSKGIRSFRENNKPDNIMFFKNLSSTDFLKLLYFSDGIIGNSSVAIRECSFLGVPAVNIGTRQQGRERGANVVDVDYDREAIKAACIKTLKGRLPKGDGIYGDGHAGKRIADLLAKIDLTRIEKRLTY